MHGVLTCTLSILVANIYLPERVVESLTARLADMQARWEPTSLSEVLHGENAKLDIKQKDYMTILRHRLTGMKVRRGMHHRGKLSNWVGVLRRLGLALRIRSMYLARNLASHGFGLESARLRSVS